jgi:hypothetical protein
MRSLLIAYFVHYRVYDVNMPPPSAAFHELRDQPEGAIHAIETDEQRNPYSAANQRKNKAKLGGNVMWSESQADNSVTG